MIYSMHPEWLRHSISKSLYKLNMETIDCVYLADPIEMGLKIHLSDME